MRLISLIALSALIFVSCKKKDDPEKGTALFKGMLVLSEGLFQQNNSTVAWANFNNNSVITSFFKNINNRDLGDTGNDMQIYGGKVYIVMNVSSTVEVISAKTGKSIKQIPMEANGVSKQPRSIAFNGSKAYVTCFDGFVDVIDTNSLEIETRIPVGANPEGLAVSNNRLFVANSGGLNFPNMDSTVSIIDLGSNTEISRITVGLNPGDVEVDQQGEIYVISRGDYSSIPSRMHRINPTTGSLVESFTFDASEITRMGNSLLISYTTGGTQGVALFNSSAESMINANFLDLTGIQTVYEVSYNPYLDRIYVSDALDYVTTGYVFEFSNTGSQITSFHVGLNPSKIVFYE